MALDQGCTGCGKTFTTSGGSWKIFCDDCDGTNAIKNANEKRWQALPIEEKIEELRRRVDGLEQHSQCDGRF